MLLNYKVIYGENEIFTSSSPLENIIIKYNNHNLININTERTVVLNLKNKYTLENFKIGNVVINCKNKVFKDNLVVKCEEA